MNRVWSALWLVLAIAPSGARVHPQSVVEPGIAPRSVDPEELARCFDSSWILPEDLAIASEEGTGPAWDLSKSMADLVARREAPSSDDPGAPRSLGDIVFAVRRAGGDATARERVFARTRAAQPTLMRALEPVLAELLSSESLVSLKWDPDHDDPRDGLAFARPLSLAGRKDAPWKSIDGSKLLQQACALVWADLDAIKAVENDFAAYTKRPGASYEKIYPLETSFVRCDEKNGPSIALLLHFRCDLPFPFSHYTCDLHIQNRTADDGTLRCDIYSTSRDFLWLAGRDVFLPVRTSDGVWVGTLVVRVFGFDLRGVPDGDSARRSGLRSSLGSLKRDSETLFAKRGAVPRTIERTCPPFEIRGAK